jgi:hypothetical protein
LVIEVAIVPPDPIQRDMEHPYLRRREGRSRLSFPNSSSRRCSARHWACRSFRNRRRGLRQRWRPEREFRSASRPRRRSSLPRRFRPARSLTRQEGPRHLHPRSARRYVRRESEEFPINGA